MDNSQWLSVKDIVSKYKKFNVPSLQRTYRWGEKEITLLLNDLYEFYNTNEDSTKDFYPPCQVDLINFFTFFIMPPW